MSHSSGYGNGNGNSLLCKLCDLASQCSSVNIRVNVGGKVEGINTSYNPNHINEQDHLCVHLCIHLSIGGNTEVNMEGLNTSLDPSHMDHLCQASCLCFTKTFLKILKYRTAPFNQVTLFLYTDLTQQRTLARKKEEVCAFRWMKHSNRTARPKVRSAQRIIGGDIYIRQCKTKARRIVKDLPAAVRKKILNTPGQHWEALEDLLPSGH